MSKWPEWPVILNAGVIEKLQAERDAAYARGYAAGAASENEACYDICDERAMNDIAESNTEGFSAANDCAKQIRARLAERSE